MSYCTECGKEAPAGETFCRQCGARLATVAAGTPEAGSVKSASEHDLSLFIGKNADKYLAKFRSFTSGGGDSFAVTWHWPAFFIGPLWMLYRKLYLWALLAIVLGFIPFVSCFAGFVFAVSANYLYYRRCKSGIERAKASAASEAEQAAAMARAGGTSSLVVLLPLIIIPVIAVLAAIAVPQFVKYRQKAYDVRAKTQLADACSRCAAILAKQPAKQEVGIDDLTGTGFYAPQDVEMFLVDGRRGSLSLSARHRQSRNVFVADTACSIREEEQGAP